MSTTLPIVKTSSNMSSSSTGSHSNSSSATQQRTNAVLSHQKTKNQSQSQSRSQIESKSIQMLKTQKAASSSPIIPLRGNLRRIHNQNGSSSTTYLYSLSIQFGSGLSTGSGNTKQEHELFFSRTHYEHIHRLFCIMDTESRGLLRRSQVREFVALRCPVFRRRDNAIQRILLNNSLEKNMNASGEIGVKASNNTTSKMSGSSEKTKIPNLPNFGNLISFPGVPNLNINLRKADLSSSNSSAAMHSNDGQIGSHPHWNSTFDEVWSTVVSTSLPSSSSGNSSQISNAELSLEGWMLFCRLIALAQYQEAKSRFSAKHLQPNSEIIMVELPPPTPPPPLNLQALLERERGAQSRMNHTNDQPPVVASLPLPELDLNHCLIAAHDNPYTTSTSSSSPFSTLKTPTTTSIIVSLFGVPGSSDKQKSGSLSSSAENTESLIHTGEMEFVVTTIDVNTRTSTRVKVKRTMQDMEWLHETFAAHQRLGGTLCGRILPPFPSQDRRTKVSMAMNSLRNLTSWGTSRDKKWDSVEGIKNAKELERCLNYFMEHPALRTSFPLNAILKASQSGLDAAKRILDNDDNVGLGCSNQVSAHSNSTKFDIYNFFSSFHEPENPNLAWIRTAAQAAMALKVHGILNATGCASASAKLQHASLPSFDTSKWWRGDYNTHNSSNTKEDEENGPGDNNEKEENQCFENGVVSIESELDSDEAYDLLPAPAQPPSPVETVPLRPSADDNNQKKFHYGKENSISIDGDIHKLYEIINAMENTLTRCQASSGSIADARRERNSLHLAIVKGLDSWEGLRGEIVGERALMEGVVGLERVRTLVEDGDWSLRDSLSWQSSLAISAVAAAETVRSAVRAARTALSAKTAAESAALAAQKHCSSTFANPEEARAAQTRASISHSHAIHAAVIEHEAFGAKRRAAMALAHDVNCWNEHRKREMLEMLKKCARSQKEGARASRQAWVGLRDGMYGVTSYCERMNEQNGELLLNEMDFDNTNNKDVFLQSKNEGLNMAKIVPVDHKHLAPLPLEGNTLIPSLDNDVPSEERSLSPTQTPLAGKNDTLSPLSGHSGNSDVSDKLTSSESTDENDVMTASMQSLVDGLMTWGGRYDPQDDMSLPSGMAVNIALEESGVLRNQEKKVGKPKIEP